MNEQTLTSEQQTLNNELAFAEKLAKAMEEAAERIEYDNVLSFEPKNQVKTNMERVVIQANFVSDDNLTISPVLPIEEARERYLNGESIDVIARTELERAIKGHQEAPEIPVINLKEAKEHITLTVINTERNQKILENCPHFEVGDLSAIPRWIISDEMSFVVTNDAASNLRLTPDEVLMIGKNKIANETFEIKSMQDTLKEMFAPDGIDSPDLDMLFTEGSGPRILVVSSQNHCHGARALLSEETLKQVHGMLGSDFIVLPSSIHEILCVPDDGQMSYSELRSMVREVNATQVQTQDFLSDNILRCDGQKLKLIMDDIKMDIPKVSIKHDDRTMHYAGMTM